MKTSLLASVLTIAIAGATLTIATPQFSAAFAQSAPAAAPAATTAPAAAEADSGKTKRTRKAKGEKRAKSTTMSEGRKAARERQKQCGAEWKAARAAGTVEKGQTWPKYWSACNTRLKAKAI